MTTNRRRYIPTDTHGIPLPIRDLPTVAIRIRSYGEVMTAYQEGRRAADLELARRERAKDVACAVVCVALVVVGVVGR